MALNTEHLERRSYRSSEFPYSVTKAQGHLSSSPLDKTHKHGEKCLKFENHGDDTQATRSVLLEGAEEPFQNFY